MEPVEEQQQRRRRGRGHFIAASGSCRKLQNIQDTILFANGIGLRYEPPCHFQYLELLSSFPPKLKATDAVTPRKKSP